MIINEAITYDPFKKDMKIDDKNGRYTDGWGHGYSVKRIKSDKLPYKELDYQYDYKRAVLDVFRGSNKVDSHFLSISDWLDSPEYHIERFYKEDKYL